MRARMITLAATAAAVLGFGVAGQALADTYTYDALGRLTQVVTDNGSTIVYTYDNADNRTAMTVTGTGS